ncbi:protein ecdysoneless [Schistocerca cancellata]|uniref:protein ecdysoneless n=1 Tax=Schistocerca cancellata TaxID=274614 RepID=UPI0021174993|nr:protein ecdysoneless [Schistocerca cancellata]
MAGVLETVREEDYVEYYLFSNDLEENFTNEESRLAALGDCVAKVQSVIDKYTHQYIWHKDPFNVRFRSESSKFENDAKDYVPLHLHGITHFGDNIEDEWFIVFLLLQLTKEIPGLVVRVVDSDGEFLLIEAAECLPLWANPDTCEGKVYLFEGKVHIIEERKSISIHQAVNRVRDPEESTEASQSIQDSILERIGGYPGKITELLHRTTAYIPVRVAALLKEKPNLIAPAVLAFCNRDPIDLKACRIMRYFPPENRVMTSVVMTRCLYAMLVHQQYQPDRRTGWNLPAPSSPEFKSHSLGMKIACGVEILASQAKPPSVPDTSGEMFSGRSWHTFVESLRHHGYFQDELEGSKGYKKKLEQAKQYYVEHRDSLHCRPSVAQELLQILSNLDFDEDALRHADVPPPDDDSWLEVSPADIDRMLEQRYGRKDFMTADKTSDPSSISAHLSRFLDHVSGVEGAEFPSDDLPPKRPKRGIKPFKNKNSEADLQGNEDEMSASVTENKIAFDPEAFSCAVQNILDFAIPEDSWDLESDGSGMSSYEDELDMDIDQLKKGKGGEQPKSELKQYMDQMDQELASTTMGQSFEKSEVPEKKWKDDFEDVEDFKPVDIDLTALKNILESYQAQMGGSGPASNLLGPMGVHLKTDPPDTDSLPGP